MGIEPAVTMGFHLRTVFWLHCEGHLVESPDNSRVPGGTRLHVEYTSGVFGPDDEYMANVCVRAEQRKAPKPVKFEGEVLSGSDWILVRDDGVLVFDGRLTLGTPQATVVGQDIADRTQFEQGRQDKQRDIVFNTLLAGVAPWTSWPHDVRLGNAETRPDFAGECSVVLPLRVEASTRVEAWASPRFRNVASNFLPYSALVLHQCLAIGTFRLGEARSKGVKREAHFKAKVVMIDNQISLESREQLQL